MTCELPPRPRAEVYQPSCSLLLFSIHLAASPLCFLIWWRRSGCRHINVTLSSQELQQDCWTQSSSQKQTERGCGDQNRLRAWPRENILPLPRDEPQVEKATCVNWKSRGTQCHLPWSLNPTGPECERDWFEPTCGEAGRRACVCQLGSQAPPGLTDQRP